MKQKRVWRYYCDYCNKGGCSKGHMVKHEKHCTMNPNRLCGLCEAAGNTPVPIPNLIAALTGHGDDWATGMTELRDLTDDCPACILAAIRQSHIQDPPTGLGSGEWVDDVRSDLGFNYREEHQAFWSRVNEKNAFDEGYY